MPPGRLAAAARAELREPRKRAEAEPDRRKERVEDKEREGEDRVPEHPAPERHLLPHFAVAPCLRRSTVRRTRWAISSIESSETSITGHPSRRWISAA